LLSEISLVLGGNIIKQNSTNSANQIEIKHESSSIDTYLPTLSTNTLDKRPRNDESEQAIRNSPLVVHSGNALFRSLNTLKLCLPWLKLKSQFSWIQTCTTVQNLLLQTNVFQIHNLITLSKPDQKIFIWSIFTSEQYRNHCIVCPLEQHYVLEKLLNCVEGSACNLRFDEKCKWYNSNVKELIRHSMRMISSEGGDATFPGCDDIIYSYRLCFSLASINFEVDTLISYNGLYGGEYGPYPPSKLERMKLTWRRYSRRGHITDVKLMNFQRIYDHEGRSQSSSDINFGGRRYSLSCDGTELLDMAEFLELTPQMFLHVLLTICMPLGFEVQGIPEGARPDRLHDLSLWHFVKQNIWRPCFHEFLVHSSQAGQLHPRSFLVWK